MKQKSIILTTAAALLATLMACGGAPEDVGTEALDTATHTEALSPVNGPITPVNDPECAWGEGAAEGASVGLGDPTTQASCTSSNCWSNGAIQFGCNGSCTHQHCGCSNQTVCCNGVCSVQYICRWGSCHNGC